MATRDNSTAQKAATQPLVLSPTEGEKFEAGPLAFRVRVLSDQTGGSFELHELAMGPATIDYHIHRRMDETLYVVEGDIEFIVSGEKFMRPAGSVAFVPRGVHHGFTNHGPARARVLIHFSPSGNQHEYFRGLERLFAAPELDAAALQSLQKQYDQELVSLR
jgi:quercetin dioxygenase-like cupin family protein